MLETLLCVVAELLAFPAQGACRLMVVLAVDTQHGVDGFKMSVHALPYAAIRMRFGHRHEILEGPRYLNPCRSPGRTREIQGI